MKRRRKTTTKQAPQRKGRKDLECADCGALIVGVDANAERVHCARCTAKRVAPPSAPKPALNDDERRERAERRFERKLAIARGEEPPATPRGKASRLAGKVLVKKRKTNPRARGHSKKIWDAWSGEITYEALLALGAKPIDIHYEIKKGWVKVK